MLKKVVQVSFLLIGGTLGVLFLPHLFKLFSFTSSPWINNPYVSAILRSSVALFAQPFPNRTNC